MVWEPKQVCDKKTHKRNQRLERSYTNQIWIQGGISNHMGTKSYTATPAIHATIRKKDTGNILKNNTMGAVHHTWGGN